jgi:hypothetical protein
VFDDNNDGSLPARFTLYQNYPNPFNSSTTIQFEDWSGMPVTLEIFNIHGQRVLTREFPGMCPGIHIIEWNGFDQFGRVATSGTYLYRITIGGVSQSRKMVLLK